MPERELEGIVRAPRRTYAERWVGSKRENLGSAMVVGMERGLFTFPNDRLDSSGRGRDLVPIVPSEKFDV